jgi:site-specific DNA recombinase
MTMNPAYIGKRVFRGEAIGDGIWEPLVDQDTF